MVKNGDPCWIGKKYGKLTVVKAVKKERGTYWVVECECGAIKTVHPGDVKSGKTQSCGCLASESKRARMRKFEHAVAENKRLYGIYNGIKKRCYNKNEVRYKDYGGRGIKMADEWCEPRRGFDEFVEWSIKNGYADDLSIDRIDVNGDYCPENCRWVTMKEQSGNTRQTRWVEYKGEKIQLYKLCERLSISYDTVHDRIYKRGWTVEKALETPSVREGSLMSKCKKAGVNYGTVISRINRFGWSEERAINTPSVGRGASIKTYGRPMAVVHCAVCGKEFTQNSVRQKYCGPECHAASKRKRKM